MGFEDQQVKTTMEKERLPYWIDQLKSAMGSDIKITIDFDTFPGDKLKGLDDNGMGALRNAFRSAAGEADFKAYLVEKIGNIHIKGDDSLDKPKYTYDAETKTLTITATSKDKHWIGYNDLLTFMRKSI